MSKPYRKAWSHDAQLEGKPLATVNAKDGLACLQACEKNKDCTHVIWCLKEGKKDCKDALQSNLRCGLFNNKAGGLIARDRHDIQSYIRLDGNAPNINKDNILFTEMSGSDRCGNDKIDQKKTEDVGTGGDKECMKRCMKNSSCRRAILNGSTCEMYNHVQDDGCKSGDKNPKPGGKTFYKRFSPSEVVPGRNWSSQLVRHACPVLDSTYSATGLNACENLYLKHCKGGTLMRTDLSCKKEVAPSDKAYRESMLAYCNTGTNFTRPECLNFCTAATGDSTDQKAACNALYDRKCSDKANQKFDVCCYKAPLKPEIAKWLDKTVVAKLQVRDPLCLDEKCVKSGYLRTPRSNLGCLQQICENTVYFENNPPPGSVINLKDLSQQCTATQNKGEQSNSNNDSTTDQTIDTSSGGVTGSPAPSSWLKKYWWVILIIVVIVLSSSSLMLFFVA